MNEKLVQGLRHTLSDAQVVTELPIHAPNLLTETRHRLHGQAFAAVYPRSSSEVSALVKFAMAHDMALIPRGGGTSRNAAALPTDCKRHIVLCMDLMNTVREVNTANASMIVEAGVVLADAQRHAAAAGLFLPLSLGSEERCTIGGCIAHNAGGLNVLRYGNTRDQLMGLEYVLADGSVVNNLHSLRKNNTGYALDQLIAGSEGTLAIITAASLKLAPPEVHSHSVMLEVADMTAVVGALQSAKKHFGTLISSFEFMADICLQTAAEDRPDLSLPYTSQGGFHIIMRVASSSAIPLPDYLFNAWLAEIKPCAFCCSGEQYSEAKLWAWRYALVKAERKYGLVLKHDIAVPTDKLAEFMQQAENVVTQCISGARPYPFGHVGDGNIHYNIFKPLDAADNALAEYATTLSAQIHALAVELGGTYSAEHGIGLFKRELLKRYSDPNAMELMKQIKTIFDRDNRFNPDKLWESE